MTPTPRHPAASPSEIASAWRDAPPSGRAALERFAPRVLPVLDALEAALWRSMADARQLDLIDLAARVAALQHGMPGLERPSAFGLSPWSGDDAAHWRQVAALDEAQRSALGFAEQMCFDVASIGDDERSALFEKVGAAAPAFVQAIYVADLLPRARGALDALFGASRPTAPTSTASDADVWAAIEALIREVPKLTALDAVGTELVRLLGARHHRCRVCQSIRSRSAMVAGADDATFDAVDHFATSELGEAHKAALAFSEAMLSAPVRLDPQRLQSLRRHFSPTACTEIVLDVTRNATNKVAVALAADAPRVESGYEIYDIGPDGELVFGLEAP